MQIKGYRLMIKLRTQNFGTCMLPFKYLYICLFSKLCYAEYEICQKTVTYRLFINVKLGLSVWLRKKNVKRGRQNKVLQKIYGLKKEKARKRGCEEIPNLYSSQNIGPLQQRGWVCGTCGGSL
jgi:hypothetical protein